ncbi:3-hydroxyacyl-CoA dehydrogenase NAD-binding domain-containing protein [Hoeflea ulvae]|uniref:3-hydroxyacyl-CoA dehydrogenase NAD-binding domain-containing protein n=1 Tax=Hoeflea ulvae TaxID=2983764 RepID=A0ABT3YD38_9HYPH|nr:3-hydroxyacyl-CoA dehydrogenase NAD-binding domain-containing protein [Hoeflea ulvae]MCY0093803.1 3-hydroxyacyl-CoA dehydrogenase NAD-binding domain-containing protein [Hoeflea ulvae]
MSQEVHLVVLGAGSIGVSFAAVFRDAGFSVTICDPDPARRDAAVEAVDAQKAAIRLANLEKGGAGPLSVVASADDVLAKAALVIEAGPERLEAKQAIFATLLARAAPDTILATASSAIPMSRILPDPADQARCLVAHPVNPPAVLRLIELCPAPATTAAAMERAASLFDQAGFRAVRLGHEIEGFVLNRLQGAVLREAYRLVDGGVIGAEDLDAVMRLGLGPRWALSGPFETAELNTPGGIRAHAARMGPAYKAMGEARGETGCTWSEQLVSQVEAERRAIMPLEALPQRANWRVKAVARLIAARDALLGDADER